MKTTPFANFVKASCYRFRRGKWRSGHSQ